MFKRKGFKWSIQLFIYFEKHRKAGLQECMGTRKLTVEFIYKQIRKQWSLAEFNIIDNYSGYRVEPAHTKGSAIAFT